MAAARIENKTLNSMAAFAIHSGARLNTDYGSLANSYGLAWHTPDGLTLGSTWHGDDGVTRGPWSITRGVVT